MSFQQFQQDMEVAHIAREVIDHAGLDVESALVPLDAVSDKQRDYAGTIRLEAIADIWTTFHKPEHKTPEMARAIIRAVNRQKSVKWWCDHENRRTPRGFYLVFMKTIKEEWDRGDN